MKNKLILILIFFALCGNWLRAQSTVFDQSELPKYWMYRMRLEYFISPGTNGQSRGEYMVAGIRNKQGTDVISYGDQMVHFGYYLGVLATEWQLLERFSQDNSATLDELNHALDAFVRVDLCESRMPWYKNADVYDGFFMRQDVPEDFITMHPDLNKDLDPSVMAGMPEPGNPGYVEHVSANDYKNWDVDPGGTPYYSYQTPSEMKYGAMSQDNAIGLLKGLALVHKCIPSGYYAHEKASEIAGKVISKIWGAGSWIILDPNGDQVPRGSNAYFYAIPLTITNLAMDNIALPSPAIAANANVTWQAMQYIPNNPMNNCMTMTMAALCNCWNGGLTGFPGINTSQGCIYQLSEQDNWDTFYLLLWAYLHDKNPGLLSMQKVRDQLAAAPCNGPYCYDSVHDVLSGNGWASTYKFEQGSDYQNNGKLGSQGNYNGLDFMLLYNLYCLVNLNEHNTQMIFIDARHQVLYRAYPYCVNTTSAQIRGDGAHPVFKAAFESITSTELVDNLVHGNIGASCGVGNYDPGYVVYRAGERITLKPGFKVSQGAYFRAYIQKISCSDLSMSPSPSDEEQVDAAPVKSPLTGDWNTDAFTEIYAEDLEVAPQAAGLSGLSVFPNPFRESFTVYLSLPAAGSVRLMLYDPWGICVYQTSTEAYGSGMFSLEVSPGSLKPGIYQCVISSGDYTGTASIIKN